MTALAPVMQRFFTQHLAQRRASSHTIAAYRDCFQLLLRFTQARTGKAPAGLELADLDAELIGAFLDHLEHDRDNSIRTRNLRLTAIHSLFSYAALRCPDHAEQISRVLAIPPKRHAAAIVSFLTRDETTALLAATDRDTILGRRDHALLLTAVQTGLRVSELTALRCRELTFATGVDGSSRSARTGWFEKLKTRTNAKTFTARTVNAAWLAGSGRQGRERVPEAVLV